MLVTEHELDSETTRFVPSLWSVYLRKEIRLMTPHTYRIGTSVKLNVFVVKGLLI